MLKVHANGAEIPAIGLGTWTLDDAMSERMVAAALKAGYRHIDTAAMYGNEAGVGAGLRGGGVARNDVFVTTKVWHDRIGDGALQASLEESLQKLGLDDVDLALIHWPSPDVPVAECIGALNNARERGLARHIGVANFTLSHLEEAVKCSAAPLAVNQIEYHPLLNQDRLLKAARAEGIAITSDRPLARGGALFSHPAVTGPAGRLGVSPAQVVLRWQVQQEGVIAIPRTSKPERLPENLAIDGFELQPEEMDALSALREANERICAPDFSPAWDQP